MATIHLDYVTFALLEPHDFSWLRRLGAVFLRLSRAGFRQPTVRRRTGRDQTLCQICGCPDDGVRRYAGGGGRQAAAGGRGLPGARPSRPDRDERGAGAAQWIRLRF